MQRSGGVAVAAAALALTGRCCGPVQRPPALAAGLPSLCPPSPLPSPTRNQQIGSQRVCLFSECSSRSVPQGVCLFGLGAEGLDGPLQDLRTEAANLCGMCTLCSPHCFGHRSRVGTLHTPRGLVVPLGLRTTLRRNFAEQPDSKLPAGWAPSCSALTLVTAPFFAPGGLPSLLCKSHDQNTVMLIKCGRAAARSGFQSR